MDPKKRLWIYTGLVLVAGVGLVTAVSSKPAPNGSKPPKRFLGPGAKLLLVGDSLAQGLATPLRQLAQGASVSFAADGRLGTRLDQWAKQPWLKSALTAFAPTLVLVSLGTNDMKLQTPGTERPFVDTILATVRSYGAEPLWIGPPSMPFDDRGVRALLQSAGVALFRSETVAIPRAADGIHPTAAGYAGWAGLLWKWVDAGAPAAPNGLAGWAARRARPVRHRRVDSRRKLQHS